MKRRISALLLSVVLCLSMLGTSAFAMDPVDWDNSDTSVGPQGGDTTGSGNTSDDDKPGSSYDSGSDNDDSGSDVSSIGGVGSTEGGKVTTYPSAASEGDRVTITVKPSSGYTLDSLVVTDSDGNKIELTKVSDTEYTFIMPKGKVTVTPTFVKAGQASAAPQASFSDVPAGAYYADAVAWAVARGITNGTTANTFSPNASCTRAQMVTFLWRAAGSPSVSGANPFTDVQAGTYYYDAVLWAVSKGITTGTSTTTFSPDVTVTRSQTVTFLYRYEGSPAVSGSSPFTDVSGSAYYASAVQWAVNNAVTTGTSATTFSPDTDCSRAQIVTFLYRDLVG